MHFVGIALAVFGGLWLFVQWAEWRERRREFRLLNPKPSRSRPLWIPLCIGASAVAVIITVIVNIAVLPTKPSQVAEVITPAQAALYNDFLCRTGASGPDLVCPKSR